LLHSECGIAASDTTKTMQQYSNAAFFSLCRVKGRLPERPSGGKGNKTRTYTHLQKGSS
jgi:hypothetical protein